MIITVGGVERRSGVVDGGRVGCRSGVLDGGRVGCRSGGKFEDVQIKLVK